MNNIRTDGIYYYYADDKELYFAYKFQEDEVVSFATENLQTQTIRKAMRHSARGSYLPKGINRLKIAFSRDTTIDATILEDDTLDIVINSEYGEQVPERRIYQFKPLDNNASVH